MANQTSVTITADTSRYERAMRDMQLTTRKTTQFISSAWIKAAGAIYSVGKAYEYAKIGAQAEQEMRSFENLAASYGANADLIVAKLREASAGTVDTMTLVSKAGTAMMMGISPDKISKLMEIARATSKMTGQTVTKAFEDISLAVGRQSRMILDNLGIIIRVEEANAAYAAALGITSDKLTDAQKKMAFMNATVEAGEDLMRRLGEQTMTTAEMFQNFEAVAKNAWTGVSKFLAGFARWGTMILSEMASAVNDFFADTLYYLSSIPEVLAKIPGAKAIGLDVIAKETRLLADYFKDSANWAHQFAVELWNINDAPIPMVNRAGGGTSPAGGDHTKSDQNQIDYATKILWHDASQIKDMWLEFDKGRQEAHQRALQIIEQQEADAEAARISRLHDTYALEGQMLQDKYGAFEMARFQHAEIMAGLAEQQSQAEIAAAEKTAQMKQQAVSSSLNYVIMAGKLLLSTTAKDSKAVFAVTKAASLAQALVGTYAGAANALDDVPYPYNIAAAASVIAYGMAQVAAITSTGIGGGGGGVPVASPTTASAVDVSATQPMQAPTESKGEIHFHLEGNFVGSIPDEIVDDMIEKINEASESRNVHINVSNAKYAESVY